MCYIDFRKAFDSVWREGLWKVMSFYGYPEKIVRLLENLYQEIFSTVRVDSCLTDWFRTLIVILQGCVLSPILFNILLEMVMVKAAEGGGNTLERSFLVTASATYVLPTTSPLLMNPVITYRRW